MENQSKNNRVWMWVIVILAVLVMLFGVLRFVGGGPEDSWICQNGSWVKHGNPSSEIPVEDCK